MKKYILILLLLLFIVPFSLLATTDNERFEALEAELQRISSLNQQKSWDIIQELHAIASGSPDSTLLSAKAFSHEAAFNVQYNIIDSILPAKIQAQLSRLNIPLPEKLLLQSAWRDHLMSEYNYSEAFDLSLQLLEEGKQMNDSVFVAKTLNILGTICKNVILDDIAKTYYAEALEWISANTYDDLYFSIKCNLYTSFQSNDLENAEDSLNILLSELEERKIERVLLFFYHNASIIYAEAQKYDIALDYLSKVQLLCEDNQTIQAYINNTLGAIYINHKQDYEQALYYFNLARQEEEKLRFNLREAIYGNISHIYEEQGALDSALFYIHKSHEFSKLSRDNIRIRESHRSKILSSLEASQQELALAQTIVELKNKQFLITLLSALALLVLTVLLVIIFWQHRKRMEQEALVKEAEAKELTTRLEKEEALRQVQSELLDSKLRELTSRSLLITHKNDILAGIRAINDNSSSSTLIESKKEIDKIIRDNLRTDDDWEAFTDHFEKVHPRFFEKIQEHYPNVSSDDRRLMAYIRMGMSQKQIAQSLNITYGSIRVSRSRLKKRLGISQEEKLDDFIRSI